LDNDHEEIIKNIYDKQKEYIENDETSDYPIINKKKELKCFLTNFSNFWRELISKAGESL
jgi:hypothetical protein